jgi:hypothetical protein
VEFIDNPRHRRSKLVRLTRKGNVRFLAIASTMGDKLSEAHIRKTAEIVRRLGDEAKGRSERLVRSTRLAAHPSSDRSPNSASAYRHRGAGWFIDRCQSDIALARLCHL